jgi:hypothetical protein
MVNQEKQIRSKFYVFDRRTGSENDLLIGQPYRSDSNEGVYRFTPLSDNEGEIEYTQNGPDLKKLSTPGIETIDKKDLAPFGLLFDNAHPVRIRHRDQIYKDTELLDE